MSTVTRWAVAVWVLMVSGLSGAASAEVYQLDVGHTSIVFKVGHLGISYTYGRIDASEGRFVVEGGEIAGTGLEVTMKTGSVDTGRARAIPCAAGGTTAIAGVRFGGRPWPATRNR